MRGWCGEPAERGAFVQLVLVGSLAIAGALVTSYIQRLITLRIVL